LKVTVDYLGHIKALIGAEKAETIEIKDGASLGDLLLLLAEKYGDAFKKTIYEPNGSDLKPNFILTVNGFLLNQLPGISTRLKEGDRIVLMPIVSGG
jgi:molybdopterin synthase sulfur carrier subunit